MARITCQSVSVFDVNSAHLIDEVESAELVMENKDVESKGVKERWDDPVAVGSNWRVEATLYVATSAEVLAIAAGTNPYVTLAISTGANQYAGNALVSQVGHSFKKDDLQMQKVTFKGKQALTVTAPS